ncbi:MAG: GTPase ObgE [Candidatus Limnocylindrales bacterium]
MFLDHVKIWVHAGDGGDGAATFRQEAHVPRGGPDGGDGGRGGSVELRVDPGLTTLRDFQYRHHFKAKPGGRGTRARRHGKAGDDLVLAVPPGTAVYDDGTGELVADLLATDQLALIAQGGRGGLGNTHFKSSTHQAPKHAQKGEPGEERWLRLELRLIADVGLVGLPNAGKSTILGAVTAADPKIADYPFTTLEPNLGVLDLGDDERRPTIADVPGLIEGASAGAGLGHAFLRHVERTRVLVHVVDGAGRDPAWDYDVIREELRLHDPALLEKPMLVAFNKIDLLAATETWPTFRAEREAEGVDVIAIAAATGEGLDPFRARVAALLPSFEELAEPRNQPASSSTGSTRWPTGSPSNGTRTGRSGCVASASSGSPPRRISTSRNRRNGSSAAWPASGSTPSCAVQASERVTSFASARPSSSGSPSPGRTVDRGSGSSAARSTRSTSLTWRWPKRPATRWAWPASCSSRPDSRHTRRAGGSARPRIGWR